MPTTLESGGIARLAQRPADHRPVRRAVGHVELDDLDLPSANTSVWRAAGMPIRPGDRVRRLELGGDHEVDVDLPLAPRLQVLGAGRAHDRPRATRACWTSMAQTRLASSRGLHAISRLGVLDAGLAHDALASCRCPRRCGRRSGRRAREAARRPCRSPSARARRAARPRPPGRRSRPEDDDPHGVSVRATMRPVRPTTSALHLGALWALAFVQPLFGLLGDSAEFFVARGNTTFDIVFFALGYALVPPLAGAGLVWAAGRIRPGAGPGGCSSCSSACSSAALVLPPLGDALSGSVVAVGVALALGAAFAAAYARAAVVRTFLTVPLPRAARLPLLLPRGLAGLGPAVGRRGVGVGRRPRRAPRRRSSSSCSTSCRCRR